MVVLLSRASDPSEEWTVLITERDSWVECSYIAVVGVEFFR
jgi:hypothetical protein